MEDEEQVPEVDPIADVAERVAALEIKADERVVISDEDATNIQNKIDAGDYAFAIKAIFKAIRA